jgi:transcriptional regulator with XRE-family HTH domain
MSITEKFGKRIKEIRQSKGISQEELSIKAQLHRTYISSIELGKRNVSLLNIEKLAKALDCGIPELFNEIDNPHDGQ